MPDDPYTFVVSTGRTDGNGNRADVDGWDLSRYLANPVIFFNHQRALPPIGRSLNVSTEADQVLAQIELANTALGQEIASLIATGYIRGASAAWLPIEWEWLRDRHGYPTGIHSHLQELLEISIVGLPANPDALLQAAALDLGEGASSIAPEPFQLLASHHWLTAIIGPVPTPITAPHDTYHPVPDTQVSTVTTALHQFNQQLRGTQ